MKQAPKQITFRQSELFESFSPLEMNRLISLAVEIDLPRNQILFSAGDPSEAIYYIEKGRVRIFREVGEGKVVLLQLLGPGDLIGEAIWEKGTHESSAETLEDVRLYELSNEDFDGLVRSNPEFSLRLIQVLGNRLKQSQSRIEDLVFRQVPSRVARLLLSLADTYGKVTTNGIRVDFRLTHQDIADLVGSSRVTITQVLNRFRDNHWIDIESKRVTIHNNDALEDLVDNPLA